MAESRDALIIDVLAGKNTVLAELEKVMQMGKKMGTLQAQGFKPVVGPELQGMLSKSTMLTKGFTLATEDASEKIKVMSNRFDMNVLSWMFGGMALQRIGLGITRFLIPSMDKLALLNDYGAKKVLGVTAAFEFLKVSLFETLSNTDLFGKFVEWIVKAAVWMAEFTQKHPELVEMAAVIGGLAAVLGTIAIGVGIYGQLEHIGELLGVTEDKATAAGSAIETIGTIVVAAKVGLDLLDFATGNKDFDDLIKSMGDSLMLLGAVSGKPWMIAIGFTFKYSEQITSAGKNLMDKSIDLLTKPVKDMSTTEKALAGLSVPGALGGAALMGIGTIVETLKNLGTRLFESDENAGKLSKTFDEQLTPAIQGVDDSLVTESLVPSLNMLLESIKWNIEQLPLMATALVDVKSAIDDIPDVTHKYVYIHTVRLGGDSESNLGDTSSITS